MNDNILLVDDDPSAIQLMGHILSGVSQLRFATNGEDALRLARESMPDLILLHAEMPGNERLSGMQDAEGGTIWSDCYVGRICRLRKFSIRSHRNLYSFWAGTLMSLCATT